VTHQIGHGGLIITNLAAHLYADGLALPESGNFWRGTGTGAGITTRCGLGNAGIEEDQHQGIY